MRRVPATLLALVVIAAGSYALTSALADETPRAIVVSTEAQTEEPASALSADDFLKAAEQAASKLPSLAVTEQVSSTVVAQSVAASGSQSAVASASVSASSSSGTTADASTAYNAAVSQITAMDLQAAAKAQALAQLEAAYQQFNASAPSVAEQTSEWERTWTAFLNGLAAQISSQVSPAAVQPDGARRQAGVAVAGQLAPLSPSQAANAQQTWDTILNNMESVSNGNPGIQRVIDATRASLSR